jgi:hypothetical protein
VVLIRILFFQIVFDCSKKEEGEGEWEEEQEQGMCETYQGKGWLLCDFYKGQKTNVQAKNNRIYRRCPTCKAVIFNFIFPLIQLDTLD